MICYDEARYVRTFCRNAKGGIMEFTCRAACDQKALTARSRALRKTIRSEQSFLVRRWGGWVIVLAAVGLWLSWGTAWQMALTCVVIFGLVVVNWKGDTIDAYAVKRWGYRSRDFDDAAFYPDHFLIKTAAAESRWQYDTILALAETGAYLVLVMGKDHALAMEKTTLAGGSLPEFRRFLEKKSGQKIRNIGG